VRKGVNTESEKGGKNGKDMARVIIKKHKGRPQSALGMPHAMYDLSMGKLAIRGRFLIEEKKRNEA